MKTVCTGLIKCILCVPSSWTGFMECASSLAQCGKNSCGFG